jgi:hypothetical protein
MSGGRTDIMAFQTPQRVLHPGETTPPQKDRMLAKPNYQFEKRQRDLANKKKKEEKRQKKLEKSQVSSGADPDQSLHPETDADQAGDKETE